MEKQIKILIVIIILLVAGLGLCVGLLLGNNFNQPVAANNTTTNVSTQVNNSSTTGDSSSNSNNNYISESQAISIAKSAWPVTGAIYYISSYPTSDSPYYWVTVHNSNNNGPGGFVKINAINGEVVMKGT